MHLLKLKGLTNVENINVDSHEILTSTGLLRPTKY